MATKNLISVYIDGKNLTANTVVPLKIGNFLDERLDECQLSLRAIKKENFKPLTPVEIRVKNKFYWGNDYSSDRESEEVYYFIIANDVAYETQIGKGLFNHDLYLVEVTKAAECCVVDTITFTNDTGRFYAEESSAITQLYYNNMLRSSNVIESTSNGYKLKSGISAGDIYIPSFGQLNSFRWVDDDNFTPGGTSISYDQNNRIFVYKSSDYKVRTEFETEDILDPSGQIIARGTNGDQRGDSLNGITVNLEAGSYIVEYTYLLIEVTITSNNQGVILTKTENIKGAYCRTYYFTVVENKLPLKDWTITDVINRTLDIAEPLQKSKKSRFRLNGVRQDGTIITPDNIQNGEEVGQAYLFDKILAPQFSFTKQTLRECLQGIGAFIHGEPRIIPKQSVEDTYSYFETAYFNNGGYKLTPITAAIYKQGDYYVFIGGTYHKVEVEEQSNGSESSFKLIIPDFPKFNNSTPTYKLETRDNKIWIYELSYDMFASQERSGIYAFPYTKKTVSQVVDSYATYLDSSAENLVNQLDKYSGVIVEPYKDGAKSVRAENTYVRIEEGNMLISTQYPIYSVEKLEYVYAQNNSIITVDITPYLFEKSVYDTQLSSYKESAYPYSKAYGIYYTQGAKNIAGLNFKVDAAAFAAFKNYAIVNIIRQATGDKTLFDFDPLSDEAKYQFPKMCFRVTYTPFYNVRVAQTKPYYKDFSRPAALIYNQQANVIESRYYGENLKGAIARTGNVEKSLTYLLYDVKQIPKAGQMFDKDYYISVVMVEMLSTVIKCTIGLSKDFNRLSAYIGINSVKRFSEISQNQAVERNTLYREYIVVGTPETPDNGCLIGDKLLDMIADTFTQNGKYSPLSNVCAWGTSYLETDVANGTVINLPVISSAFGNSISFSWKYEDNYSAGDRAVFEANAFDSGYVSGYFQNSQPYTDYYGRLYYYNFDLQTQGILPMSTTLDEIAQALPAGIKPTTSSGYISSIGKEPFVMRKDNREALQVNFQIDFVSNVETLIIGSALASYCPAVRGSSNVNDDTPITARLYVFDTELNKFTDHVESYENVDLSKMQSAEVSVRIVNRSIVVNASAFPTTESGATTAKSWAIITAQRSKTKEVEDEKGNTSTQTTYYGGDLLIGQNIEVKSGEAFTPIYLTPKREIFSKTVWKDRR